MQRSAKHLLFRLNLGLAGRVLGLYRCCDSKIVISVDIAWDELWNCTEQVRNYRIEGDRLHIEAAPQPYVNFGGRVMRGIQIWARD